MKMKLYGTTYNLDNPKRVDAVLNRISKQALYLNSVEDERWDACQRKIKEIVKISKEVGSWKNTKASKFM